MHCLKRLKTVEVFDTHAFLRCITTQQCCAFSLVQHLSLLFYLWLLGIFQFSLEPPPLVLLDDPEQPHQTQQAANLSDSLKKRIRS